MSDNPFIMGEIHIRDEINESGEAEVKVSLPSFEDVSLVQQLGMLEVARATLLGKTEVGGA